MSSLNDGSFEKKTSVIFHISLMRKPGQEFILPP